MEVLAPVTVNARHSPRPQIIISNMDGGTGDTAKGAQMGSEYQYRCEQLYIFIVVANYRMIINQFFPGRLPETKLFHDFFRKITPSIKITYL